MPFNYKNYTIIPKIVCFDIRYFVYGEGFTYNHYADIIQAQNAIDTYICKKYLNNLISNISNELNVSENVLLDSFREIILNS